MLRLRASKNELKTSPQLPNLMSNFLLMPLGSAGDTYPLIGIGTELRRRGHGVSILVNGHFKAAAERAGLEYVEMGAAEDYLAMLKDPDIWDPQKGFKA